MQGKRRASQIFDNFSQRKVSKNQIYSGILGIITNGAATVEVTGRENFVWVRLRNVSNEVIQAFNDSISNTYDLPVLVEYDPHNPVRYRIIDRDVGRYQDWGGSSTQMAPHGWSHSFTPDGTGGGDPVWVYSRQIMPYLTAPSGTAGYLGAIVYSHIYYHNNAFHYAGDTGTPNLSIYKPTNNQARMVLLYLDTDTGNIMVATGTTSDFAASITGSSAIVQYIPDLPSTEDIPLAGVRLLSGTSSIQWANLYDVRPFFYAPGGLGGIAPTSAQYVTMALDGTLSAERKLTSGSNILIADGGANGNVTISVATGIYSLASHNHGTSATGTGGVIGFSLGGNLSVGSVGLRNPAPRGGTIENVAATLYSSPTGSSVIVDIHKDGTTIFSTQGNRPTITAGNFDDLSSIPDVTSFDQDDIFTCDIDQIGASGSGAGLVVQIRYKGNA